VRLIRKKSTMPDKGDPLFSENLCSSYVYSIVNVRILRSIKIEVENCILKENVCSETNPHPLPDLDLHSSSGFLPEFGFRLRLSTGYGASAGISH